jgi:hypothetical protein
MSSSYGNNPFYQSLLGTSQVDNVNSAQVNTRSLTVSSLTSGLVSATSGGTLQNANIGSGLSFTGNTLNNTGLTSITSGATGPVYISTSSTGSVEIALPQNLTTSSSPQFARLLNSSIGTFSVIQGTNSGNLFTGDRCVLIGDSVMSATSASQQSTAIGNSALGFASGNFNTAVGSSAGFAVTTGTINTIVGTNAGRGTTPLTTGSGNVLLGAGANTSSASSSNEIVIGLGTGSGSNTAKIYASNGLNVSNLTNGVLKATSGTITSNATTDDLTEGKTNLYFTNARAQGAFIAGTGIDISSGIISNTSVTGTTGPIGPIGFTGPIGPIGPTGYTGPIGVPGVGGTIGYYGNYYSTTTQSISSTAQQITFPNFFVQNGISLDGSSNITFNYPGTYKITTLLQVNGSNNAKFYHWYRYNGVDVANSAFEDHFSSGAGQVLSTSSGLITVVAGDTLGLWGLKTAGTIEVQYTPGSVSPAYPASTSVNIVVSQETYTQIGPTGYTGPQSLTTTNLNVFGGVNAGISRTTATGCVGLGYRSLESLTTSLSNTAVGTDSLRLLTSTAVPGSNTAVGFASLSQCSSGYQNTAIGSGSGRNITTAKYNTLVGMSAGANLTTGDTNFHLGLNSGFSNTSGGDNISIGSYSMAKNANQMTGPNGRNIGIGHYSAHSLSGSSANNVAIGYQSLWNSTAECSDNICIGTNSGSSIVTNGGGNIAIGGSSTSVGGTLTNGQGYNIGVGIASNLYISANARNNIGIGAYSNFNTSTGISNISIGNFTQASSATSSNEITMSTNGTLSVPISGKGANTCFVDARAGLFSFSPAYCLLRSTAFNNGIVTWEFLNDGTTLYNNGFQLLLSNTLVVQPYNGVYEITVSGSAQAQASLFVAIDLYVNNVLGFRNIAYQSSGSINTFIVNVSGTQLSRPSTGTGTNTGWSVNCNGGKFFSIDFPLFMTIKFISL